MRYLMRIGIFCFAVSILGGCTESSSAPSQGGSVVIMRTQPDISTVHSTPSGVLTAGAGVDSLQVTQAVFSAQNFMLRSDISDEIPDPNLAEGFIHLGSFLLAFDIGGIQYIGQNVIFAATYRRARFDIQPIHASADSLAQLFGPYASLFASGGSVSPSTIIIKGFVWKNGFQLPFTYSTALSGSGSIPFDTPLVVPAGGAPMEVRVRLTTATAFTDKNGSLMDPRDFGNAAAIDANIKTSLKAALLGSGS